MNYDTDAIIEAEAWADAIPSEHVEEIVWNTIQAMAADGLEVVNYAAMHELCDPNQYLGDATDELYPHLDGDRMVALANRCTDRFDELVAMNTGGAR